MVQHPHPGRWELAESAPDSSQIPASGTLVAATLLAARAVQRRLVFGGAVVPAEPLISGARGGNAHPEVVLHSVLPLALVEGPLKDAVMQWGDATLCVEHSSLSLPAGALE
jgi:hypothetical protein